VSVYVDTFGTGVISDEQIQSLITQVFDFRPQNIRKELNLDSVKFQELSKYGHFGREDLAVRWEHVNDKITQLRKLYEKT
jgi:S-adenosylmethionine synthetase